MKKILQLSFFILLISFTQSHGQLTANFYADTTQGCAPLDSVQFIDTSIGNPTTWNWNFGNSNTSTLQNPQASYPNPGVYTVTLTVGNGSTTDTEVKTGYITVYALPVAHFTYTPLQPCTNSPVTFIDNSVLGNAGIASWDWGFGDGNTSTVTTSSTTHSYSLPITSAPVSVIVTDSNGCESDFDTIITVINAPVVAFTASPITSCHIPATVNFTDNSVTSGTVSWKWDFGDAGTSTLQNPSHVYTATNNYTVKLVVTQGGCKDSLTKYFYVKVDVFNASFIASDTSVCVGDSIFFTETSAPLSSVSRSWNFGDGSPLSYSPAPSHVYGAAGVYTVRFIGTDAYGCGDTVTHNITVNPQPVASLTANDTIACSIPFTVNFTSPSAGGITNWLWDFGDSGTSSVQNPTHTYTAAGSYTVTLIVTNSNGCKDTLIKPGYINIIPPFADFTFTPKEGCAPLTVNFTSTSTAIEPFFNYTWNFGDASGNFVTTAGNTTHTYTTPGVYTVSLIVNTINGCKDTLIKVDSVFVGFHVTPSFTISDDTVCYHQPIQFTFNTPGATTWTWIFGDGGVDSLQQDPLYIYGDTGTFTVSLIACNNGCCDTLTVPLMITILPPKAQFSLSSTCANPYTVTCVNSSAGADSTVWNFHDGSPFISNTSPISHTFATRGVKAITIYAFNYATGCVDSMTILYQVTDPIARFKGVPLQGCYPLSVTFTDTSQDATDHLWLFGDSQTQTTPLVSVTHVYSWPGLYTVTEIITDIHGCKDTLTKPDYIHVYGPLPGFTVNKDTGCAPLSVIFTDTSHLHTEYPIVSYIWNFGDGEIDTVTAQTVPHTYLNPGSYTVTLTVIDSMGCTYSISFPNYIRPTLPIAAFVVDTFACPGEVITFNASSSTAVGGIYHWTFGDGGTLDTTINTATHTYAANGNYTVTLTLTDQNSCDSSVTHNILIENPVANFSNTAILSCGNAQVTFYNLSNGTAITSAFWNFGNGGTSVSLDTTYNNYVNPGYYTVSLIVTNSAGCKDTLVKDSIVVVPGPIGSFDFFPKSGCRPLEVTFVGNSPNTINYTWDFGDGNVLTTTANTVTHIYNDDITAYPSLTISAYQQGTSNLCQAFAPVTNANDSIVVQTFTDVNIGVNGDTTINYIELNEGEQLQLSIITNITGGNYIWSPSGILTCDTCLVTSLNGSAYEGYIYLEVNQTGGCKGLDSILVKIIPCDSEPVIPNIFTPNGDGDNDEFFIERPCPDNFLLTIYNRWGQEVFKTNDPLVKWDGRIGNGEFVPSGTYYWILGSRDKAIKGFLQLIREKKN